MLKLITTLLLLPSLLSVPARKGENDIQWNVTRPLTWADFKSQPDRNATNAALTSSKIIFNYSYGDEKGFSYNIGCVFDKTSSWGKVKTEYILAHEQGHFDIAEIYARKLNKALKHYSFNTKKSPKEVPAIYRELMKEEGALQNQYDSETDFSRDKQQQEIWLNKIQRELGKLGEYAGYH